jgi:predicted O-methyltransferase YrrM
MQFARDAQVICELGAYEGKTSVALALATAGTVYAVDPFFSGRSGIPYGYWIARLQRRRYRASNLRFIVGMSWDLARIFDRPIDLLFIDADHSLEAVRRDWADWVVKVRAGGCVALHDCKLAPSTPQRLGSVDFYENTLRHISAATEIASTGSLVVFRIADPQRAAAQAQASARLSAAGD